MQEFYRKSLLVFIALLVLDALLACYFIDKSYLSYAISPAQQGNTRWHYATSSDIWLGGTSTVRLTDAGRNSQGFDFKLTKTAQFPFAGVDVLAEDAMGKPVMVDLSQYTTITFLAKCVPTGSMTFHISVFDEGVSTPGQFFTYPAPYTFFACNRDGVSVSLDMRRLTIPQWWLNSMKLELSHQGYKLDKVAKLSFGTSPQTPFDVDAHVEISEIMLHGRDYRYIAALVLIILAGWSLFAIWFFRTHSRTLMASLNCKLKKDLPLVAYRQLTVEPYKDREKASVLKFIATNYTKSDLDLDGVVAGTGANRNKVNEVLKTELGMTFTSYLNKLRLTEAARLLTEQSGATVAEIAYSVGYANVSYFNKLFKEEYGSTPKAFRTLAALQPDPARYAQAEASASAVDPGG